MAGCSAASRSLSGTLSPRPPRRRFRAFTGSCTSTRRASASWLIVSGRTLLLESSRRSSGRRRRGGRSERTCAISPAPEETFRLPRTMTTMTRLRRTSFADSATQQALRDSGSVPGARADRQRRLCLSPARPQQRFPQRGGGLERGAGDSVARLSHQPAPWTRSRA
jgi:hypothetical protein